MGAAWFMRDIETVLMVCYLCVQILELLIAAIIVNLWIDNMS